MLDLARRFLSSRVVNAGAWSLIGYGVVMVVRFGSNLIMTRLLLPEMFGIMAIASVVMFGVAMLSDVGLKQNIIQSKRGDDPKFLNTAWLVQIMRGLILGGVTVGIGGLLVVVDRFNFLPKESVYADPKLPSVIFVLSVGTIIGGFGSTKWHEASRNLLLSRVAQIEIVTQLTGFVCMLLWVSIDRSIWALIAGSISASLTRVLLNHFWLPGTPNRLDWDWDAFREIFRFGKWIFLSSVVGFLTSSSDRLLLGAFVDTNALGVYAIAFLIYASIDQALNRIMTDVLFPALSGVVRERRSELKNSYYRAHRIIGFLAYFSAGALIASAQFLIDLLYDHRYSDAGWMLQILAVTLLTLPSQLAVQTFLALGRPEVHSRVLIIRLIGIVVAMPIGFILFGIGGALWGFVASSFISLPLIFFYNLKAGLVSVARELIVLPTLLLGLFAGKMLTLIIKLI